MQNGGTEYTLVERHSLDEQYWTESSVGNIRVDDESFVCSVAEALEPDDEVIVNGRSRPLTVLGFEEQRSQGAISGSDWPYHILWLRGNGTEYRLRWSHLCEYYPHLNTSSELETTESYSIKHGEPRKRTRATSSGERVSWLCPVGVDKDELPDWTFLRNVDGLDDFNVDTNTEQEEDHV